MLFKSPSSEKRSIKSPFTSAIYEGSVRHRRNLPRKHEFDFRFFMLYIDLDEMESVFELSPFWSSKRWAVCRLNTKDHQKKHSTIPHLRDRVLAELNKQGLTSKIGPIRLLTQVSYLGYRMNPVSFYYCFDPEGANIEAIVAEVNNTPWGEQHTYVIPGDQLRRSDTVRSQAIKKDFHVSPFFDLSMNYRMAFSVPGNKLAVKIENHSMDSTTQTKKLLDVTMALERRQLNARSLNGLLVRYPLISFRVFAGIYWQALKLYLKKIPFVPHPTKLTKAELEAPN